MWQKHVETKIRTELIMVEIWNWNAGKIQWWVKKTIVFLWMYVSLDSVRGKKNDSRRISVSVSDCSISICKM